MKKKSASASRGVIAAVSTLLAVAIGVTSGAASYRSLICSAIGGDMYKTVDESGAQVTDRYPDNGMSLEDWKAETDALVEEVTGEGIVLLKNENSVLPLAKGSRVTLFGRSSAGSLPMPRSMPVSSPFLPSKLTRNCSNAAVSCASASCASAFSRIV